MAEPPDELGAQGADQPDLDPEDAPVELDEEGFLVSSGRRWQFPTDLDVWVRWAAAVVVGVAAFETLAYLISGSLSGWGTGIGNVPLPRPEGYYSLLLLAGVLLLVLRRGSGSGTASPGWARGSACLGAGTGAALAVAQLAGNIGAIVQPSSGEFGLPAANVAGHVISGIGGFADAVIAAFAATLAVLVYRWSRIAAGVGTEDTGESEPEGRSDESGTSTEPDWGPRGSVGPAVASLLVGAAVAVACLIAFAVGQRNQVNSGTGLFPVSVPPVVTIYEGPCTSPAATGGPICPVIGPLETATPSPSP